MKAIVNTEENLYATNAVITWRFPSVITKVDNNEEQPDQTDQLLLIVIYFCYNRGKPPC